MIVIFIHQNFPAQYLHIVRRLAEQPENQVFFITQETHNEIAGIRKLVYDPELPPLSTCHAYTVTFDTAVRTATAVAHVCRSLRDGGIVPDVVDRTQRLGRDVIRKGYISRRTAIVVLRVFLLRRGSRCRIRSRIRALSA